MEEHEDVTVAPFECELCNDRFETREELKDHVWEVHEMDGDITM